MIRCALLDENDVYIGMAEVEEPTDRHLPDITSCDLPPGEYKWDLEAGSFKPIPKKRKDDIPPNAQLAIAAALIAIEQSGTKLPASTHEWLRSFVNTVDGGSLKHVYA